MLDYETYFVFYVSVDPAGSEFGVGWGRLGLVPSWSIPLVLPLQSATGQSGCC